MRCYRPRPLEGVLHIPQKLQGWRLCIRLLSWWWGLTPLQRFSRCILQPQSNGINANSFSRVLILFYMRGFCHILYCLCTKNYKFITFFMSVYHVYKYNNIWNYSHISIWINFISISYLPNIGQDMTQVNFFKRSLTGLNSEFSFS